VKFKPLVYYI